MTRARARKAGGDAPAPVSAPLNVLVLGMHRSGTSAVAGALRAAGFHAGREIDELSDQHRQIVGAHTMQENPLGFTELPQIVDLNDRLLSSLGWHWDTPPAEPEATAPPRAELVGEGRRLVDEFLDGPRPWVLKDPRISVLLPWWRQILLDRFIAVVAVRPPEEVAWSLAVRNGMAPELGLALWAAYHRHLAHGLEGLPVVGVDYAALTDEPEQVVSALIAALASLGTQGPFDVEAATTSIRPLLRRSTEPRSVAAGGHLAGSIDELATLWRASEPVWIRTRFEMASRPPNSWEIALIETHRHGRGLEDANARFQSQIAQQRSQQARSEAELETLRESHSAELETVREAHSAELASLRGVHSGELAAARRREDDLHAERDELRVELVDAQSALDSRERSLEAVRLERGQLQAELASAHAAAVHSEQRRQAVEAERDSARRDLSDARAELARLARHLPGPNAATWLRFAHRHPRLARGLAAPAAIIARLRSVFTNPLFDREWYVRQYPDVSGARFGAYRHYRRHGIREGRNPNPFVDIDWYLDQNPDVRRPGIDPLDHYLRFGGAEGRDPSPRFDSAWYLLHNPDVLASGANPLLHYLRFGRAEGRAGTPPQPSPTPETPAAHPAPTSGPAAAVERIVPVSPSIAGRPSAASDVRLIAFYLPQFHPIPENDVWWGEGFTEWRNVASARPQFPGHYQPHVPGELGFYDLRLPETRQAQADLARSHGIHGFCYYHYWFNGKQLLERPFAEVLGSGEPDLPFALCWANDPWSRKWDGREDDLLQAQTYSKRDDLAHIRWLIPALSDSRAITVDGRPMFLVYRGKHLPDPARTTDTWRREVAREGLPGIYLVAIETPWDLGWDATAVGFDAKVLFQPQFGWLADYASRNGAAVPIPGKDRLEVYDYASVRDLAERIQPVPYRRYETVVTSWDNTARVGDRAVVLHGASPAAYEEWLGRAIARARTLPRDERLVFVNSWNEWAEGCHLEPDLRNGRGFLEATLRAASRRAEAEAVPQLVRPGYAA